MTYWIKITPDLERAKNLLRQSEIRLEDASNKDQKKFSTLIIEAYYEIIKELLTALLVAEGIKVLDHIALIDYVREHHSKILTEEEIRIIDELRKIRHKISYEGFSITEDYCNRRTPLAKTLIDKIKKIVEQKIK